MSRPPKPPHDRLSSTTLHLKLTPRDHQSLVEAAEQLGLTASVAARMAVLEWLRRRAEGRDH